MSELIVIAVLLVAIASSITSLELLRADGWRPFRLLTSRVARSRIASKVLGRDTAQLTLPWPDGGEVLDADELSYRIGVPGAERSRRMAPTTAAMLDAIATHNQIDGRPRVVPAAVAVPAVAVPAVASGAVAGAERLEPGPAARREAVGVRRMRLWRDSAVVLLAVVAVLVAAGVFGPGGTASSATRPPLESQPVVAVG